jgi:hypothetical protein
MSFRDDCEDAESRSVAHIEYIENAIFALVVAGRDLLEKEAGYLSTKEYNAISAVLDVLDPRLPKEERRVHEV